MLQAKIERDVGREGIKDSMQYSVGRPDADSLHC